MAVQPLSRTFTTPVKALLLVGMADGGGSAPSGLLTDAEQARVSGQAHVWLGPDGVELARVARMYLLSALGMAQEAVYFSYSLSAMDGSPLRPALAVERLRRVFPELKLSGEPSERVLSGAVDAAVYRLSQGGSRAAVPALARLPEGNAALARFTRFLGWDARSDALGEKLAARAFGDLARVSASRLEQYAQCPFRHFVTYGLAPQIVEPFALKPVDEGSFFHEAVRAFSLGAAAGNPGFAAGRGRHAHGKHRGWAAGRHDERTFGRYGGEPGGASPPARYRAPRRLDDGGTDARQPV